MVAQTPDDAHCLGCNYPLRGLPDRVCPECGRAFDPDDPSTYRYGPWRPYWRRCAGPPRLWSIWGLAAVTLFVLIDLSAPGLPGGIRGPMLGACALQALAAILATVALGNYVLRAVATSCDQARAEGDREDRPGAKPWRWAAAPVCVALLVTAFLSNWPLRTRFALSRSAFERAARQYADVAPYTRVERWVGWYYVSYLEGYDTARVSFVTGDDSFDPVGFAYRADDPRPSDPDRIAPCWYVEKW